MKSKRYLSFSFCNDGKNENPIFFIVANKTKTQTITFFILSILLYLFQLNTVYFIKKTRKNLFDSIRFLTKWKMESIFYLIQLRLSLILFFWNLWFLVNTPFFYAYLFLCFFFICFVFIKVFFESLLGGFQRTNMWFAKGMKYAPISSHKTNNMCHL